MREAKYRAWDEEEERMIYSDNEQNDYPFSWHLYSTGLEIMEYDGTNWNALKKIKFMQDTGLKDKNGKKIYDGDIVKIDDNWSPVEIGQVEWIDTQATYLITWTKWGCKCAETFGNIEFTKDNFEVIGNIYENLLE